MPLGLFTSSTVKSGRWGGVVTAFIMMSDIKDEIDWEFPGNHTTEGQTNYFWQGVIREWSPQYLRCTKFTQSAQPLRLRARRLVTLPTHSTIITTTRYDACMWAGFAR